MTALPGNESSDLSPVGRVLTAKGGLFELPPDQQHFLCYFEDGRLLVDSNKSFSVDTKSLVARITNKGLDCRVIKTDADLIKRAYDRAGANNGGFEKSSDSQQTIITLIKDAASQRASDIHLVYGDAKSPRIEFRIFNDLALHETLSMGAATTMAATIYNAMCDVAEPIYNQAIGQDARIASRQYLPANLAGIRVGTLPLVDGSAMTLRLLYNNNAGNSDLGGLGFSAEQQRQMREMRRRPTGIVLVGGPTNSGKSTTLQRTMLLVIQETHGRKRVITVEDPPEYPIPGALQSPVSNANTEEERTAAFHAAIRYAMRSDPNIIMIGEVRDLPSAELAIRGALTGHQMYTTVHVSSAFGIIDRLLDLGISSNLLLDPGVISGLMCQRLLKVLCPHCKIRLDRKSMHLFDKDDLERIDVLRLKKYEIYVRNNEGCEHCKPAGIVGLTLAAETVKSDLRLIELLRDKEVVKATTYWKERLGGMTMLEHAVHKIRAGQIDPFEAEEEIGSLEGFRG